MSLNLLRPQPIGLFPPPAELLVLPACSDQSALSALMRGDLNVPLPAEWSFFRAAAQGRVEQAKQCLAGPSTPIALYNLFVLNSEATAQEYHQLRPALPDPLAVLLDVAAFQHGLLDELPSAESLDAELKATLLLARASRNLEQQDAASAISDLEDAIAAARATSPVLAALLLGQLAGLRAQTPGQDSAHILENYRDAIKLAGDSPIDSLRAELWLNLGSCYQEHADGRRDLLTQAIQAYQQAIQSGLSKEHHPEMYALAHNNLGLAYLSMPMVEASDALRKAVAIQSFREALEVYTPETHRLEWVSAKLNLANALQHLPTSHPRENLLQAVDIYEELLQARTRAEDPVGYARLLANQANALAHLGSFSQALEKANEAHKLFQWHNERDAAQSVLELVASVHEKLGNKEVTA